MSRRWIAERTKTFDNSGIRKAFELASQLKDPIDLSIGQPDFDVPESVQDACIDAIRSRKNGYAVSQGMPVLREKLQEKIDAKYGHTDRKVFVCSGTSGGLVLSMMSFVNPGEEVIVFDPCFVMYEPLVTLMGGRPVPIATYPDFRIDLNKVADAITPQTKLVLLNSPSNPTGVVATPEEIKGLAELAAEHDVALLSDEVYSRFCFDEPFVSPAGFNERTIVVDGFSKSHAMTGWRLGFVHGPAEVIDTMIKLQQYSFVCAPQPVQWAGAAAMEVSVSGHVDDYRRKRDMIVSGLSDLYELAEPGGAFYAFPKTPWGTGTEFAAEAGKNNLLIISGGTFSHRDTHFRLAYAADDEVIAKGIEVLRKMARK